MSDQQPPQYPSYPTGGEHWPTPPTYGTPPPQAYVAGQYGPSVPFASWGSRVGAYLLDGLVSFAVVIVPIVLGAIVAFSNVETNANNEISGGVNGFGVALMVLGALAGLAFGIWNTIIRQGKTGQTLGKKWLGISVVRADSGAVLGVAVALLRYIMMAIVGGACFLNYLWPLWDDKKQTWHDKIVGSVVIAR